MTFAAPLGLLALLAIPAIVAIHLLRRRFPPRPVAGLFLWKLAHDVPDGGRRIDRLPWTVSLLLECLAALALALIIAGATLTSPSGSEHLVVLVDDSVSMTARGADGESPRDRAVQRISQEVARIGPRGRVTIVRSGERPAVIAGPAAFSAEAGPALDAWTPLGRQHSLSAGLRLARELSGGAGSLLILSDRVPDPVAERLAPGEQWTALGRPLPNVGIVDADRAAGPGGSGGALTLTLRNNSGAPAARVVQVAAGDRVVATRGLTAPAGTSLVTLPLPPSLPPLSVALEADALAADDSVVLVEPRPRIVAVDNRLEHERGRAALDRAIDALTGIARAADAHLAFDESNAAPDASAGQWLVRFGAPAAKASPASGPADLIGPFVLEKRHPLLQGVTLGGVVWTGARPLGDAAVHPLASAGEYTLIGTAAPRAAAASTTFVFNLELARTNLIRSPDWPILISNLVEMRRRELPGPERWNYRVGELVRIRLERPPAQPVRLRMGTLERTLPQARVLEFVAPAPGGLAQIVDGDRVLFEIGINLLEEQEGDLRSAATHTLGALDDSPRERRVERGAPFDPLFWSLLAVCAAAMLANWLLLSPRRRVA